MNGQAAMLRQAAAPLPGRAPQATARVQPGAYPLHQSAGRPALQPAAPQASAQQAAGPMQAPLTAAAVAALVAADEAEAAAAEAQAYADAARSRAPARGAVGRAAPARGGNGLFAAEPTAPAGPAQAMPVQRKSLFGIVTGAIRGHHVEPAPAAYAETAQSTAQDTARADVRQTLGEEMQIDIPAFLRRQSS